MEAEAGLEGSEGETEQRCFKLGWKNNPASPLNCQESNQRQKTRKTASGRMLDPLIYLLNLANIKKKSFLQHLLLLKVCASKEGFV